VGLPGYLFLDVGGALRPGVIDHHHLVGATGSTTGLVFRHPELLDASASADSPDRSFTVVLHENPDLDCVASACLAIAYLTEGRFPPGAEQLARYVDLVDQGALGLTLANPFSLYAACMCLANRPAPAGLTDEACWQRCAAAGVELTAHVLARVADSGTPMTDVDAFAWPGLFDAADRRAIGADVERYKRKLAEPRTRPRVLRLCLPGQEGGTVEADALLVRDVQGEDDPGGCLFFKDWARSDARRSPNGRGFVALSVFQSEGPRQKRRCILSVTPHSQASLCGLGAWLDEAEGRRRWEVFGVDDRVADPLTGAAREPRPGYTNADPWYDGRAHEYTIVDAPRSGTLLSAEDIEAIFLRFAAQGTIAPLRIC
jgi:hypothetical protein